MKKTILCGLFLGLGMIIGSGITVALRPHFFGPHRSFDHKMKLSESEREQVKKLFREDKEDVKGLVAEMEQAGKSLKEKLKDPNVTDAELTTGFQKFNEAKQKLTNKRFEMNLKIRKVVGPDKMDGFDVLGPVPFGRPGKGPKGPRDEGRKMREHRMEEGPRPHPLPPPEEGNEGI